MQPKALLSYVVLVISLLLTFAACNDDDDVVEVPEAQVPEATPTEPSEVADATTPIPESDPTSAPEPTPEPHASDMDVAALLLTRDEMGDGWRRNEVLLNEESAAPDKQYCGWGEEVPGWISKAETTFEATDGSVMIQYVYHYPEDEAVVGLEAFAEQIANCDAWSEATEQGEVTTYLASWPMPNLGDDAVSFHLEMVHQTGMELGEFVIVLTRYDDLIVVMGTEQSQPLNLGYRGSAYLHTIDAKVRDTIDRPMAGWGDPIRTTHGLEIIPHELSDPYDDPGFPDSTAWLLHIEACAIQDGVDVNQYVEMEFNVESSGTMGDDWSGTLNDGECTTGDVRFITDEPEANPRAIRYDITPAITEAYGWLEWRFD